MKLWVLQFSDYEGGGACAVSADIDFLKRKATEFEHPKSERLREKLLARWKLEDEPGETEKQWQLDHLKYGGYYFLSEFEVLE